MWWTLFSVCIIVGLVCVSYRRLVALRKLARWAAPFLESSERRTRGAGVAGEGRVASRLEVADLNEATIELGSQLEQPGLIPRSCAKTALSLGALVGLMQAAVLVGEGDARGWLTPMLSFGGGCVGALGCSIIGRSAEVEARRLRDAWRSLIRRSTQDVPT